MVFSFSSKFDPDIILTGCGSLALSGLEYLKGAYSYVNGAYSRPSLGATTAPNLVPWVLEIIISLEMVKCVVCLGGTSK